MRQKHYYIYKQATDATKKYTQEEFDNLLADYEKGIRKNTAYSTGDFSVDLNSRVNDRKAEFDRVNYDINRAKNRSRDISSVASIAGGVLGWKLGDGFNWLIVPRKENAFLPFIGNFMSEEAKNKRLETLGWDFDKNRWADKALGQDSKRWNEYTAGITKAIGWGAKLLLTAALSTGPYLLKNNFIEGPYDAVHDTIGFNRAKVKP